MKERVSHNRKCKVSCNLCYRYGKKYPCKEVPGEPPIKCDNCRFIFKNQDCYSYHRQTQTNAITANGPQQRSFQSICQQRFHCLTCDRIVFPRFTGYKAHRCPKNFTDDQLFQIEKCFLCKGIHLEQQPCFIQPLEEVSTRIRKHKRRTKKQQQNIMEEEETEDTDPLVGEEDNLEGMIVNEETATSAETRVDTEKLRYFFFDIECCQDRPMPNNPEQMKHCPILVMADVICAYCIDKGIKIKENVQGAVHRDEKCSCGPIRVRNGGNWHIKGTEARRLKFESFDNPENNPVEQMITFLFDHGDYNTTTIALSHNGGKYDIHLVLEAIHKRPDIKLELLMNGLKIFTLDCRGRNSRTVIFKDTCNYFRCKLAALPKTFSLEGVESKPYFPHLFTKYENLDLNLERLPDAKYYAPEWMSIKERAEFIRWHSEEQKYPSKLGESAKFNLRRDLVVYCSNDVAILREASICYRALTKKTTNLDPFVVATTVAGQALKTYRHLHLKPNVMVHSPEGGLRRNQNASVIALRYMRLYERLHNVQVQTAEWSTGEATVEDSGFRLDGLVMRVPPQRPLAIEFMGCLWVIKKLL